MRASLTKHCLNTKRELHTPALAPLHQVKGALKPRFWLGEEPWCKGWNVWLGQEECIGGAAEAHSTQKFCTVLQFIGQPWEVARTQTDSQDCLHYAGDFFSPQNCPGLARCKGSLKPFYPPCSWAERSVRYLLEAQHKISPQEQSLALKILEQWFPPKFLEVARLLLEIKVAGLF